MTNNRPEQNSSLQANYLIKRICPWSSGIRGLTKVPLNSGFDTIPYSALYVLYREGMYGCKLSLSASLSLKPFGKFYGFELVCIWGWAEQMWGRLVWIFRKMQSAHMSYDGPQAGTPFLHWYSGKSTRTDTSSGLLLSPSLQHTGHQIGSNSKTVLRRALHTFFSILTEPAAPVNPDVFSPWDWGAPHNCGKAVTVSAVEKYWDLEQILQDRERC